MLDDSKRLSSFSNEPQKFGPMTLFNGPKGLTLHVPSDMQFSETIGISLQGAAEYYLHYKEVEAGKYRGIAIAMLEAGQQYCIRNGGTCSVDTLEELQQKILNIATEHARLDAYNCGDPCDLSEEFCLAASNLGKALQARADAGIATMTIIQSGTPAEKFMTQRHG